jgi:hypothetical protein
MFFVHIAAACFATESRHRGRNPFRSSLECKIGPAGVLLLDKPAELLDVLNHGQRQSLDCNGKALNSDESALLHRPSM